MENADRIQEELQKYRSPGQEITIILFRFLLVFLFIFMLSAAFVFYKSHFIKQAYKAVEKVNSVAKVIPIPTKEKYVFLLLGTDMLIDVNRTDSMILVMLSVPDNRIDIISLPRDCKIEIPGHGAQKMNSIYTFEYVKTKSDISSIKKVVSRIEEMSDIKVDYYVKVDLSGFEKIINLFGGVEVDVEKNMNYDDSKQDLHIRLKKGLQILDGKHSLQYCRFRHDRLGDIGRMQRQQKFLKALVNRMKEGRTLVRLPEIISGSLSFVTTNVDLPLLVALLGAIPEPSKLQACSHSMPGDFTENEPVCYFLPNLEKYKKLMKDITSGDIVKIEAEKARLEADKAAAKPEIENKKGVEAQKAPETKKTADPVKEAEIKKSAAKKDLETKKAVEKNKDALKEKTKKTEGAKALKPDAGKAQAKAASSKKKPAGKTAV
ncbi:MAG TPA: LCP family protein, partial [Candidatus Wallbacteria bacterium]|nr:LCP family protein [Candidatus Wallbacteria bacterium]